MLKGGNVDKVFVRGHFPFSVTTTSVAIIWEDCNVNSVRISEKTAHLHQ